MPGTQARRDQADAPGVMHNDAELASDFSDASDLFMTPSSSWSTSADELASATINPGIHMPHLSQGFKPKLTHGSSNRVSLGFNFDIILEPGSSLDMSTNISADGDTDWMTFMQLAGFSAPGPEAGPSVDFMEYGHGLGEFRFFTSCSGW